MLTGVTLYLSVRLERAMLGGRGGEKLLLRLGNQAGFLRFDTRREACHGVFH